MICITCGSSEFSVHGGISYCKECSTQIKEKSAEQAEDLNYSRRSLFSTPTAERTSTSKEKKQPYGSWIMAETYNIIIFEQVSALIKLGASPKLKPTVLHIWSNYLQKCEIAFRKDYKAADNIPRLGPLPTKRDLNVLYGDTLLPKEKKKKLKKILQDEIEQESNTSDTQSSDVDSDSSSDCKKENLKYSFHTRRLLRTRKMSEVTYRTQVYNMNLAKTLGFCYLGLLYTEDQLSLLDFIRFVNEERIPYINIIDKLPSSMNFQKTDKASLLTYKVPDVHSVHKMSLDIAKFLNLPQFKEPSLHLAVACYVKELNLPDDLLPMANIIIRQFHKESSNFLSMHTDKMPHDYLAIAVIIVVLKMLFVLDGKYEIEHSEVMDKFNTINTENNFFVWKEWKEQAHLKEFLFLPENPWHCPLNKIDSLSADRIISNYSYTQINALSSKDLIKSRSSLVSKSKVKNMLASLTDIPSKVGNEPTSFPLKSKMNAYMNEWGSLKMYKETKDIDFAILRKNFSSHSLSFNPQQFEREEDELSYLLLTSLYQPEVSREIQLYFFQFIFSEQKIIRTSSKYWFLDSRSHASKNWIDKVPPSFRWLVNYICKYACMKQTFLYKEITKIEKILFLHTNKFVKKHSEKQK